METKDLTPNESLVVIQEMIEIEKMRFGENGFIYRFWGWLVVAAALAQFVLLKLEFYNYHYFPWFLMIFGGIYTGIYYGKKKDKASLPISGKALGYTWIIISIAIFGVAFFMAEKAGGWLLFIILSQIAVGTVVSGALLNFRVLIIGGFICMAMAFVSIFTPYEYWSLLTIVAIVASDLVPGYMLKKINTKLK